MTILLATYNGEKFIKEQLDSLLNQSFKDFKIYIQDDCSTDDTWSILKEYQANFPKIITIYQNKINTGNAKYNFIDMIIKIKDDYIMCCDQDDIWLENKIELTLSEMKSMEKKYGYSVPILVHTDLVVVDEQLNIINTSYKKAMIANYDKTQLNQLLVQNTLTGCTVMYNYSLSMLIKDRPQYLIMHDWYLILVGSLFGKISHINDATIMYRQHNNNSVGAKDLRTLSYKIHVLLNFKKIKNSIDETYLQSKSLLDIYRSQLDENQLKLLENYTKIPNLNKFKRIMMLIKIGSYKNGFFRKLAHFIIV